MCAASYSDLHFTLVKTLIFPLLCRLMPQGYDFVLCYYTVKGRVDNSRTTVHQL